MAAIIDLDYVNNQTLYQQVRYLACEKIIHDPDKSDRLEKQLCVFCFYVGGNQTVCKNYYEDCEFCNKQYCSNLQKLCKDCAKEKRICVYCCSDINLKTRRKL